MARKQKRICFSVAGRPRKILPKRGVSGLLKPYSKASKCRRVALQDLDPYFLSNAHNPSADAVLYAYKINNLQMRFPHDGGMPIFAIEDNRCLGEVASPKSAFFDNFGTVAFDTTVNASCNENRVIGRWVLGTYGSHFANMYDDFVLNIYPLYLAMMSLYGTANGVYVAHINAPLAMPESWRWSSLYAVLGSYIDWEEVKAGSQCVSFEEVVFAESTFWWQQRPILWDGHDSQPCVQSFVRSYLRLHPQLQPQGPACHKRILLYAKRVGARKVLNSEIFDQSLLTFDASFDTKIALMEHWSFEEQVAHVRKASMFVFPHGAGGTHVLWLKPGSVAVELYPVQWANPMYRNLALMSGSTFFAYQAKAEHLVDNRQADYVVDTFEVADILRTAVKVVSNNFQDDWYNLQWSNYNHGSLGQFQPYNVSVKDLSVQWDCTKQS